MVMNQNLKELAIFKPHCPYCDSDEVYLDPEIRSNGWRHTLMMLFLLFGAGSLEMHMLCTSCGQPFSSRKNNSYCKPTPPEG